MPIINGTNLNSEQRKQVLAAFAHRWTHENAHQTYQGRCPACAQAGSKGWPYVTGTKKDPKEWTEEQWHAYHTPLITDEEWLKNHAFNFTKNNVLSERGHAMPLYEAEARRRR